MPADADPFLEMLRERRTPTSLDEVEKEVGQSVFEEIERELENETLVMRGGQVAAVTPTAYYRIAKRIADRRGGRLL